MAMSGGVDSSVAAALLKESGYDVTGVFMCLGRTVDGDASTRSCCSPQDAADARRVALQLGIPLFVVNLDSQFDAVIDDFVSEYAKGRTPNPCVLCNRKLKFGKILEIARSQGIEKIATGHYARLIEVNGEPRIARKMPRNKDQSYFLFAIERAVLGHIVFPLQDITSKAEVRELARARGLSVHAKPDSQDICFVDEGDLQGFLRARIPETFKKGYFRSQDGTILGEHTGASAFTIGQRKGLGVSSKEPLFVLEIRPQTGDVILGARSETFKRSLIAERAVWHTQVSKEFRAIVQVRASHSGAAATVRLLADDQFEVHFDEPVFAITPGQCAVCYDGEVLLGGGWISLGTGI